jgi:hypothetical protein
MPLKPQDIVDKEWIAQGGICGKDVEETAARSFQ